MIAALIVLLFISWTCCGIVLFRFHQIKVKLADMEDILSEVQGENGNRKILVETHDMMAPLAYRLNEIVYAYEEKLLSLKRADEANKQLMTSLSHDVRTPLTTLIGYLDAVHNGIVSGSEREEYIDIARRRAYDLKDYIDVLFDWFRLNSNEFTLSVENAEAAELTRNILKDWVPVFREKGLDFEIEIPEKRIMVKVDLDGYSRIINNLIQNAVAHSHASKLTITMETDDRRMKLCIADNGIGIAKHDLSRIFDRLYKCDKGRSDKGSGLGLSIVGEMVRCMDGTISVKSEVNQYTAFTIELPLQ
ncbi:MAG: HAMP domain-containing sensor histidine kinase [Lachnospiraceae bacterium]|nr:HAMP domain-containing sensor histidine kinase [Lachnospiraceae bacterium]